MEVANETEPTTFTGYSSLKGEAKVLKISDGDKLVDSLDKNQKGFVIFDQTPFYAESGGQVGDKGEILGVGDVVDCQKIVNAFVHTVVTSDGTLSTGDTVELVVNQSERRETANHHSATHLLHAALRKVLGDHVTQAGSLVEPSRLRFDFSHNKALTKKEIHEIETLVNQQIAASIEVQPKSMKYDEAIGAGALALFGEKYGDDVRVIQMGDFSTELCGGTHVSNTSQIRLFKIVSETSVSAGIRRIEALTGQAATNYLMQLAENTLAAKEAAGIQESWTQTLELKDRMPLVEWIEDQKTRQKDLQKEIQSLKSQKVNVDDFIKSAHEFSGGRLVLAELEVDDRKVLSSTTDKLRDKVQSGIVVTVGKGQKSHPLIVAVTKDLAQTYNAGKILKDFAKDLGGKGGGRPDFAQGAASDLSNLETAKENLIKQFN